MLKSSKFAARQRLSITTIMILGILFGLIGSVLPHSSHAQGLWIPVNGSVTIINNGPGDQVDPHISEGLVAYSGAVGGSSVVRYYDFLTGTDTSILQQEVSLDFRPDIDGAVVVYTHVTRGSFAINLYNTNTGVTPITLDPQPASEREKPSIGGQTVAWVDYGLNENPYISEIVVYDLGTGMKTRLTDDEFYDTDPSVSPDGSVIVWTKCQDYSNNSCHVWQAIYNDNGWDTTPLAGSGNQREPATDGQYIVYSNYVNNTTDSNIFWQTQGGSDEHEITVPGNQRSPAIDGGLVVFESLDAANPNSNADIMLYDLNTGAGYQVSNTPDYEGQPDVAVASDGLVQVVWMQVNATTATDIYASAFRLPATDNQPPVIDQLNAPLDPVMVNTTVSATAVFGDPDVADTHTAIWDWGDGNTSPGTVNETGGAGTVSGNHPYANAGVYVITLTVTDNHDAADTALFQYVVVYDPSGGFVTGSGWIDSPAGAYTSDPSLTGKAHFGFVSRYQKGASLPSGQTEFQFKAGDLSFRSTAYDWLVIAGAKAQFKGTGTINGSGDYGFLLTVTDGQVSGGGNVDKFRIKIWDRISGEVVYDNQIGADETADPSTAISGGSIVIHK